MSAQPVVVGVDGSEGSLLAVDWAALEAERRRAPLRIVSAPAMPARMRAYHGPTQTVASELEDYYARAVETAVTRAKQIVPGLVTDTALVSGPPAVAIADSGSSALLVVVGARGIGGFAAMLLGSVSRYVAMNAPCPVVVVREQTGTVQREIVVGVRDPLESTETLAFAFEEAALAGAELVALHAWHRFLPGFIGAGSRDATGNGADSDHVSADATTHLTETLNGWREKYPNVAVRPDVVPGHPAQVLAEYSTRADLVVIGRHGGAGAVPAIGSVQHAMLNHARGPVAVVPFET